LSTDLIKLLNINCHKNPSGGDRRMDGEADMMKSMGALHSANKHP
jgi:hypothetical protein